MQKNSKALYVICILSVIVLVMAVIFYGYSYLHLNSSQEQRDLNSELTKKLNDLTTEEQNLLQSYEDTQNKIAQKQEYILSTYGFDINESMKSYIGEQITILNRENEEIENQVLNLIKDHSDYYKGEYYNKEDLENILSNYFELSDEDKYNSLNLDLYDELDIVNFIDYAKSYGTIKYLSSLNDWSLDNNFLYFLSIPYSVELNAISTGQEADINFNHLKGRIDSLQKIYELYEDLGLNTGSLSSAKLKKFSNKCDELFKTYYENQGSIDVLRKISDKYEQIEQ
ncbi:MAG: hypothetical protein Q4D95_05790 [Peptoniphilus sp.]|nr:hypothetical protein [Peptoniphilus sp.]